jgi:hypothetical protein
MMESLVQGKLARRVRWGGCRNVRSEKIAARCVLTQSLRERLNALTRKTHAFAKRDATWDALVHLQLFEHNWIRPHRALRLLMNTKPLRYQPRTPAMALGLFEHPWSWITFLTTSLWLSVT